MLDILSFDTATRSEAGTPMVIRKPGTGEILRGADGKVATITLRGRNSPQFRAADRQIKAQAAQRARFEVEPDPQDAINDTADYLIACTVTWSGLTYGHEEFPPTPENIAKLWRDTRWPWLINQAERFVMSDQNFLGNVSDA